MQIKLLIILLSIWIATAKAAAQGTGLGSYAGRGVNTHDTSRNNVLGKSSYPVRSDNVASRYEAPSHYPFNQPRSRDSGLNTRQEYQQPHSYNSFGFNG